MRGPDRPIEVRYREATGQTVDPRTGNARLTWAAPVTKRIWATRVARLAKDGTLVGEDITDYTILTTWPVPANSTFTDTSTGREWLVVDPSAERGFKRAGRWRARYHVSTGRLVTSAKR